MTFLSVRSRYFYFYFFFVFVPVPVGCTFLFCRPFSVAVLSVDKGVARRFVCCGGALCGNSKRAVFGTWQRSFFFRQPVSIFSRHNALIGRLALKSIDHRQSTRRLFVLFPPGPCCCLRQSLACLRCTIYELCTDKVFGRR